MVKIRFQMVSGKNGIARQLSTTNPGISRGFHKNTITTMAQAIPTQLARE